MIDIEDAVEQLIGEVLEFLMDSPINDLQSCINHDTLYDICYNKVIDDLTAEAEARSDEAKLEAYYA